MSDLIYAIDFGTSNSLMGAADPFGVRELVPLDSDADDQRVLRSLVYFHPDSGAYFGSSAIQQYLENSMRGRFLKSMKRFLPVKSFDSTFINGKFFKLEELISLFLKEMRVRANEHFSEDCTSVVLGRPALFSEDEELDRLAHSRLEAAARLAGFKNIEFLPEPVAAAYRYRLEMKKEEVVLVADFGGGTSDYTLLKLSPKEFVPEDVLSIGGVPIAGDMLDGQMMRNRIAKNFGSETQYTVPFGSNVMQMPKGLVANMCSTAYINLLNSRENRDFLNRIKKSSQNEEDARYIEQLEVLLDNQLGFSVFESIEEAKKSISQDGHGVVRFDYPGIAIEESVSAKQFEEYTNDEISKIFDSLKNTLKKGGLTAADVDRVCCTGGTAKVSLIQSGLAKLFGNNKVEVFRNFTSIVEGLSERASQLSKV
ncbi:Hsp70 family protein [bacterium]|nr:Hsp70 family protein [bacterium]